MSQTFAELGLNPERVAGLAGVGYEQPSKLQTEVIPQILAGRDVVAEAPPGSGRTAAYVLPILQTLDPEAMGVQVLVLAQNGENVLRIARMFCAFAQGHDLLVVPVFEDQPQDREAGRLGRSPDVVVGTPGRVKEHLGRETLDLEHVQFVVVDGIDLLLEQKMQETIESLLDQAPASRQTAFFATKLTEELHTLADQHLFEPMLLKRTAGAVAIPILKHRYQSVAENERSAALARLLDGEKVGRGLIFANLRPTVEELTLVLRSLGYLVNTLRADSDSSAREQAQRNWRESSIDFLVLTDAGAEGMVLESTYVVNYDVPPDTETYAARAELVEESGTLFTLVTQRQRALLSEIERFTDRRIKAVLPPTRADAVVQRTELFRQRLSDLIQRGNLDTYMLVLHKLAADGYDWSEIAAAAVSLVQRAQPEAEIATPPRRSERRFSPRYGERREHPRAEEREVEAGYVRLIMDAGYDIGVRPKDIVGAIANEANIPGRAVGNIDIRDHFTYVEVQQEYVERVLSRVPTTRLRGRVVTFRQA